MSTGFVVALLLSTGAGSLGAQPRPTPPAAGYTDLVIERLRPVPVFVLMDSTGVPLLGGTGTRREVIAFFRRGPAEAAAAAARRSDKVLARTLQVRAVPLGELMKRFPGTSGPALALIPDAEEVAQAERLRTVAGRPGKFEGVPLFIAKGARGYLNITQNGKTFIPAFFTLAELEQLQAEARRANAPGGAATTTVDVISLQSLLTRWRATGDPGRAGVALVPSAKAMAEARPKP